MVPYELYLRAMKRYDKPRGNNIAGINVNAEKLDTVVIDEYGNIISYKTFRIKNTTYMGIRRKRAWSLIGEQIHALLKWLYSLGVSTIGIENPEIIGYLRYYWIRNGGRRGNKWNCKISMFRNSIIERITWKTPLYSTNMICVNPRNTGREGKRIGKN